MSKLFPLCSSSKGNCTYLSGGGSAVLIDAGISLRALVSSLSAQGLSTDALGGILITHEHTDHISGLTALLKKTKLPVYASAGTLDFLIAGDFIPPDTTLIEVTSPFCVGELRVTPFPTPHDAAESIGFRFELPDLSTVAIATDLGHITDLIRACLTGCDVVMLESNYDRGMLDCSAYPYFLKRRIKGDLGHLSNESCAAEALRLVHNGTTRIVLAHLSEQSNLPALAHAVTRSVLQAQQMCENRDYILKVAPARSAQEILVF